MTHTPVSRGGRRLSRSAVLALAAMAAAVVACADARSTPRPSASLLEVEVTPRPTTTPGPASSEGATEQPTFIALPVGWDSGFCDLFAEVKVGNELVIDVERALAELNERDARLLARELRDTAAHAGVLVEAVPDWEPGQATVVELAALADLGGRAGEEYGLYLADTNNRNALRRARTLRRDMSTATQGANDELAALAEIGIECPDAPLQLEVPQPVQ